VIVPDAKANKDDGYFGVAYSPSNTQTALNGRYH